MSPTIFVNYRISVSIKDANNLRTKLEAVLGEGVVFMNKYEIKTGEEWAEKIRTALEAAKVVLVLISPGWLECPYKETKPHKGKYWKKGARRLDDPEDWVRREIEIALADPAKSESVHTLLFSGAELPDEVDFPEYSMLSQLTKRQTRRITDDRLDRDLEDFIHEARLREKIGLPTATATATVPAWQDPNADLPDVLPDSPAPFIGLRHFDEKNARRMYYPVFLSHSWQNKGFAIKLYNALINRGVQVWYDEKKIKPGDDIYESLSRGIEEYDKMILVCSKESLESWWVDREVGRILEKERKLLKKKGKKVKLLIPIKIDDHVHEWDGDKKTEIMDLKIGDFRDWQDEAKFEKALDELIAALNVDRSKDAPKSFL